MLIANEATPGDILDSPQNTTQENDQPTPADEIGR